MSLLLVLGAAPAWACGPFFESPIYVHSTHPDRPFESFAAGHLGVLQGTFQPMYLAYAWRVMMAVPATGEEQRSAVEAWARWHEDVPGGAEKESARWLAARAEVLPSTPPATAPLLFLEENYNRIPYIHGDAFLRAEKTLRVLVTEWKQHPALVAEWVRNQDAVFSAGSVLEELAPALDGGLSASVQARRRAEHAYQRASADFYGRRFAEAAKGFRQISQDSGSPYRVLAAYLVARVQVRQALLERPEDWRSLPEAPPEFMARLTEAEQVMAQVLATPGLREVHPATLRLRNLVRAQLQPDALTCELMGRAAQPRTGSALGVELIDLNQGLKRVLDDDKKSSQPLCSGLTGPAKDLAEWLAVSYVPPLLADSQREPRARRNYALAVARWEKTRQLPWLVTALQYARVDSPGLREVLEAAARVPVKSPATMTLVYRSAHLLRELGDVAAARARLATVPLEVSREGVSSDNLLRDERFALARDWDEAILHALRSAAGMEGNGFSDALATPLAERSQVLDWGAVRALNPRLTARRMSELAEKTSLPPAIRHQLRWTAFTRAVVVEDHETFLAVAKVLEKSEPVAHAGLSAVLRHTSREERLFEAQLLLMDSLGATPELEAEEDGVRDAGLSSEDAETYVREMLTYGKIGWCVSKTESPTTALSFLSEEEAKAAREEWSKVVAADNSMSYLGRAALAWAQAHPKDPRSPVALYRVVRASKKSCAERTSEARDAFRLLHRRYGKSDLAKKSKYYH
ncbi:hypothetical protein MYSTI_07876 [Myxococcus stipitatus DSM 14675]|uniref:Uncharacterized protein n=1 Tax=Myxococcus stipitatus (strain DSM 14675 / JCM 12634 / Mx s8) TaxID=1278073 RepID=L7UMA3_MYXSD|nr:hypothetical protein [Myxococcus stipitatus]AGC49148.1 hypothetical protein MYSTI_07876 [Myxococcus stipitatus DSM 14675]